MAPSKRLEPDSPFAVWGAMLRHYRERAGMSLDRLGELAHYSGAMIRALETGERRPKAESAAAIDGALGLDGALIELFEDLRIFDSKQAYPEWFRSFVEVEADAHTIRSWQPLVVDGLLQTADYAREVIRAGQPGATDEEVEELVAARLGRQAVLTREDPQNPPPVLYVLLDEGVLHRPVGGPQ
jgi:transcriptional regulator with XRE-family HTH domain